MRRPPGGTRSAGLEGPAEAQKGEEAEEAQAVASWGDPMRSCQCDASAMAVA